METPNITSKDIPLSGLLAELLLFKEQLKANKYKPKQVVSRGISFQVSTDEAEEGVEECPDDDECVTSDFFLIENLKTKKKCKVTEWDLHAMKFHKTFPVNKNFILTCLDMQPSEESEFKGISFSQFKNYLEKLQFLSDTEVKLNDLDVEKGVKIVDDGQILVISSRYVKLVSRCPIDQKKFYGEVFQIRNTKLKKQFSLYEIDFHMMEVHSQFPKEIENILEVLQMKKDRAYPKEVTSVKIWERIEQEPEQFKVVSTKEISGFKFDLSEKGELRITRGENLSREELPEIILLFNQVLPRKRISINVGVRYYQSTEEKFLIKDPITIAFLEGNKL